MTNIILLTAMILTSILAVRPPKDNVVVSEIKYLPSANILLPERRSQVVIPNQPDLIPLVKQLTYKPAVIKKVKPVKKPIPTPIVKKQVQVPSNAARADWEGTIRRWCNVYKCNPEQMIRVMYCESGGRTNAANPSGASGLFQFMPRTFAGNAKRINLENPNIWDGEQQVQVAAYMFSIGQSRQWVCK